MTTSSYEFDAAQNAILRDLTRKMRVVGVFLIVLGALALIGFAMGLWSAEPVPRPVWLAASIFLTIVGFWTLRSAREFGRVVTTEGEDIPHLMRALTELTKFYSLHFWLIVAYLILVVLSLLGIPPGLG